MEIILFLFIGVLYWIICKGICKVLSLETFNQQSWVYAIVGAVGVFLIKAILNS